MTQALDDSVGLRRANAELQEKLDRRTAERDEALAQQLATAEILQVINSSPGNLKPVFAVILEKSLKLCDAVNGHFYAYDGELLHPLAAQGEPGFVEWMRHRLPFRPAAVTPLRRLLDGEPIVHFDNALTDGAFAELRELVDIGNIRTTLIVGLCKDGVLLGSITVFRQEVRPFTDKQIALLESFAAQAVIAMENARLITETREALDQQTATAEVLQVINSSPGELGPVFDAMLEKAMRLCEATFGQLNGYDGKEFHTVAIRGVPAAFADHLSRPRTYGPGTAPARMLAGENVVVNRDLKDDDIYRNGEPNRQALVDLGGARSSLQVALRKDEVLLGMMTLFRQEVRPFTDKQIALLQNFAAQAVIAMENARLITETREALDQQTATTEVLQVINSSPGNLAPVFDAMLEKAMRLCTAAFGYLLRYDGERFQTVAHHGLPPHFAEYLPRMDQPGPTGAYARILGGAPLVHITDLTDGDVYQTSSLRQALVDLGGARTGLIVALRKEDRLLGIFTIYRQEVLPFSDKQVALLQNFAAQAVIAIENARLIAETQEALDQQTATAEILAVISNSLTDTQPVFDAIVQSGLKLFPDAAISVALSVEDQVHAVAVAESDAARAEAWRRRFPFPLTREYMHSAAILDNQVIDIPDVREAPIEFAAGSRNFLESGYRGITIVPMRRGEAAIGALSVVRRQPGPLSAEQLAVLQTFANQAVIAIENARLITETREALDQQTATAEVLQVINSSPGDLAPVFESILDKAHRLCGATRGTLFLFDGEMFHAAAMHGYPPPAKGTPPRSISVSEDPRLAALLAGERLIHVPDLTQVDDPIARAVAERGGVRTNLLLPLRKDGALLGVISCNRHEVRPFLDKEIALLENFAAQAVIAMENARLITETQEALDQQTATAEVLGVINSSPGDLKPVFEAMLEKALRLCGAAFGNLLTYDGDHFHVDAGVYSEPQSGAEQLSRAPFRAIPNGLLDRIASGEDLIYAAEVKTDVAYQASPEFRQLVDAGGYRSMVYVALRKENRLLGTIVIFLRETRALSDKQIALLQNFAAQAVIAMENARLITETREALDQQTATAEVLQVINASPGDLTPVFEAILDKAHTLCNCAEGTLELFDGEYFRAVVTRGLPEPFAARLRDGTRGSENFAAQPLLAGEPFVHIKDVAELDHPLARDAAAFHTGRTVLSVPLRGGNVLFGMMVATRVDGPFSDKQIALLQNFAAQAVIAMENARLISETREARDDAEAALGHLKAAQANLVQKEKMASLGQLTAGIAHEIKNPLNFVNNFADLSVELLGELKETPAIATLDEDKRGEIDETLDLLTSNLERIAEHGKRADGIVKSMLEHSRGGTGERREVDLNGLIEEALNLAYHGGRAHDQGFNVTLERDFGQGITPIELVPQDITRVCLNLFGNGFYAASKRRMNGSDPKFAPILTVTTRDLGDAVEIRIRDNGTGIPAEIIDKLFQPFFTTKPTGEGTGLGLSISYDIVTQQHGGTIAVDSRVDEFTEFTIRLPRSFQTIPTPP